MNVFKSVALFALLALMLGVSGFGTAAGAAVTPPPASVCVSPTATTNAGDVPMFPGRWWNPKRNGIGWDFFYGDGQTSMYLTWFTYDAAGRPVWLHGQVADLHLNAVTGETTWESLLYWITWNPSGNRISTPVGSVAVTVPYQTTTRAAVRWKWDSGVDSVGPEAHDECLYDRSRDSTLAPKSSVPTLNQAYSSNWFYNADPLLPLLGWGVDLLIDVSPQQNYRETATAGIFDLARRPVWLQSVDDWGPYAPPGTTFANFPNAGKLRYIRHVPTSTHPAVTDCTSAAACIQSYDPSTQVDGGPSVFQREIVDAHTGNMKLKAKVPAALTGGAAIDWPPTASNMGQTTPFPDPVPVARVDADHIVVNQSVCRVPTDTSTCTFVVSWVSQDPNATIERLDLNNSAAATALITGIASGEYRDTLAVGARAQYRIRYRNYLSQDVARRTPEVRVLRSGAIADAGLDPIDCTSAPGCDLGTHEPGVGAIAGQAGVSGGAASYSIAIDVPPGRGGMQPQLALNYSSRTGNGVAGLGWSLSGLSSIHRCPRTMDQDGVSVPVLMGAADALCLDGQRLVAMTGSVAYGNAGATYRTEIDGMVRVTQFGGGLAGNAACFRVEQKSGRIAHYGAVTSGGSCADSGRNSRVVPAGTSATLTWLIDQVNDRVGNNMVFQYQNFGSGETLLKQVQYTGKDSLPGTRSVVLQYEARPAGSNDISSSYLAGGLTLQTQRLQEIRTCAPQQYGLPRGCAAGQEQVRSYALDYSNAIADEISISLHSARSLLHSITECAFGDGEPQLLPALASTEPACKQPTTFSWTDLPVDHTLHALNISGVPPEVAVPGRRGRQVTPIGDLDGDGSREVLITQSLDTGTPHSYLAKYNADRQFQGATELSILGDDPLDIAGANQADIDGDGRTDLISPYQSQDQIRFYVWNGPRGRAMGKASEATLFRLITTNVPPGKLVAVEDFNADGYVDLLTDRVGNSCTVTWSGGVTAAQTLCLYLNSTKRPLAPTEASYAFAAGVPILAFTQHDAQIGQLADINGDGVSDIFVDTVYATGGSQDIIYKQQFGQVLVSRPSGTAITPGAPGIAGCPETPLSPLFRACPASALGLEASPHTGVQEGTFESDGSLPFWLDINGDGLTDVLYASTHRCKGSALADMPGWCVQVATGNGYSSPKTVANSSALTGPGKALQIRINAASRSTPHFVNAGRLQVHDADGDGRPEILYPAALAARFCTSVLAEFPRRNGECDFPRASKCNVLDGASGAPISEGTCRARVVMCGDDPLYQPMLGQDVGFALPSPDGAHQAVCGLSTTNEDAFFNGVTAVADHSAYKLNALRFQQTAAGGYEVVTLDLDASASGAGDNHTVVAQFGLDSVRSEDIYGDGLGDLVTSLGCVNAVNGLNPCIAYDGKNGPGPEFLPDGQAVVDLVSNPGGGTAGPMVYINENVGASARSGSAPVLPELLAQVSNGLGDSATWNYFPLSSAGQRASTDLTLYAAVDPAAPAAYADPRHFYFTSSMPVVESIYQRNGVGAMLGLRSWKYGYGEAVYNHLGRGFQGFRTITEENAVAAADSGRNLRKITTFHQKFPLTGNVESVRQGRPKGSNDVYAIETQSFVWRCNVQDRNAVCDTAGGSAPANFPYILQQDSTQLDLASAEIGAADKKLSSLSVRNFDASEANVSGWDAYGNLTFAETESRDEAGSSELGAFVTSSIVRKQNGYQYDLANWWIDKLVSTTQTTLPVIYGSNHPLPVDAQTLPTQQVKTVYSWNVDRTAYRVELQPDVSGIAFTEQHALTTYQYPSPSYGLPSSITVNGAVTDFAAAPFISPNNRTTSFEYDGEGYFVTKTINAVNQVTWSDSRPRDGQLRSSTDPTGIKQTNRHDAFGRAISSLKTVAVNGIDQAIEQPMKMAWNACTAAACPGALVGEGGLTASGASAERFAAYRTTTVQNGSPTQVVWYDLLGREIKTASRGFDGRFVASLTDYDSMGAISLQSIPFIAAKPTSSPSFATRFSGFDRLGRVGVKTSPGAEIDPTHGDVITEYSYIGNRTDVTVRASQGVNCASNVDNLCMRMQRYSGVLGLMRTVDALGGVTTYWNDGAKRPVAIADANANNASPNIAVASGRATWSRYNELGHRVGLNDPNMGAWTFTYNPFGEMKQQRDARGFTTEVKARDALGRVLTQKSVAASTTGGAPDALQDEWSYDAGTGLLAMNRRCIAPNTANALSNYCSSAFNIKWSEAYAYDFASRVEYVSTTNRAWVSDTQAAVTRTYYDATYGRTKAIEYPSGLRVQDIYTRYGELRDVIDADTGARFWAIEGKDLWGNPTRQRYGNGIVGEYAASASTGQSRSRQWRRDSDLNTAPPLDSITYLYDSFGNLRSQQRSTRYESNLASEPVVTESYVYDKLQRLLSATPPSPLAPVTYDYDAVGNIRSKSDYSTTSTSAYSYLPVAGNACGPNVPKTVQRVGMVVRNACDANGNIITTIEDQTTGVDYTRSVIYDPTNRPSKINRLNASAVFVYAPDGTRVAEQLTTADGAARILTHGPAGYEREAGVNAPEAATLRHELGDVVVNMTQQPQPGAGSGQALTYTVSYRTLDRLGSPLGILNSAGKFDTGNGTAKTTLSFDAFGQARNRDFSPRNFLPLPAVPGQTNLSMTHLGFTGHEHLQDLGLIHMNGRAYDYQLGRFMSVDPLIQFPANSQSLNPYSYILNNPLAGRDPTGFAVNADSICARGAGVCGQVMGTDGIKAMAQMQTPERMTSEQSAAMSVGVWAPKSNGAEKGQDTGQDNAKDKNAPPSDKGALGNIFNEFNKYVKDQKDQAKELFDGIEYTGDEKSIENVKNAMQSLANSPESIAALRTARDRWGKITIYAHPGNQSQALKGALMLGTDSNTFIQIENKTYESDMTYIRRGWSRDGRIYEQLHTSRALLHEVLHSAYDDFGLKSFATDRSDNTVIIPMENRIVPAIIGRSAGVRVGHNEWTTRDQLDKWQE